MNTIKTGLLLGALTGLLMLIGGCFGGQQGVVIAFIFAMVMNFGSYWFSDKTRPEHVSRPGRFRKARRRSSTPW